MIKIPSNIGWSQDNRGDSRGTILESFNLDLQSNLGKVRTTRTKRLAYTGSPTNFGEVMALEKFNNTLYVAASNSGGDDIWAGGNTPFDTLTNDTSSVALAPSSSDMLAWNNGLYVTDTNEVWYSTDGTAWTEVGSNVLTSGSMHLLAAKNDVLYVSDEAYKVKSVTSGNVFQGTGSQTLNLNMPGYEITMLMAGIDSIWIGLTSTELGQPSLVFEWDGETENAPSARYEINATGIMAGVVKDGTPYIVDSNGRLLVYNGGVFEEVARFPLNGGNFMDFADGDKNDRAIHPRGMAVDRDEILICVSNRTDDVTSSTHNEFPSGVWAYSEATGLYHKLSPSYQAKGDTGTTNLTDYGQFRCRAAGPLLVFESAADGASTSGNGGRIVFGMEYYSDATTTVFGLFADDTNDNTQKAGWYVSPRIKSSQFRDHWQKVYAAISDLETSGDLVEVKYRTKDETPTYATATWTDTDRFNTGTDLSGYEQGDEVTVINGPGAGLVAHISELSGPGVVLDRSFTGIAAGNTSTVRLEKWRKVGKIEDVAHKGFTIGQKDHWIQIKLYLQWTGPRELYDILIDNKPSLD